MDPIRLTDHAAVRMPQRGIPAWYPHASAFAQS
jgi:hypothetical protein